MNYSQPYRNVPHRRHPPSQHQGCHQPPGIVFIRLHRESAERGQPLRRRQHLSIGWPLDHDGVMAKICVHAVHPHVVGQHATQAAHRSRRSLVSLHRDGMATRPMGDVIQAWLVGEEALDLDCFTRISGAFQAACRGRQDRPRPRRRPPGYAGAVAEPGACHQPLANEAYSEPRELQTNDSFCARPLAMAMPRAVLECCVPCSVGPLVFQVSPRPVTFGATSTSKFRWHDSDYVGS